MSLTPSTMRLAIGDPAPDFSLPATDGHVFSLDDFRDVPALVVMFICNHCPYVQHVREELAVLGRDYAARGVALVAINSNDVERYPDDSPANMKIEKERWGYGFPYLYDEDQSVAKAYGAACTPDFFVFDRKRKLFYRGQLDDSRPGNDEPVTGRDLRMALDALLTGKDWQGEQRPSIGCNIKWKPGNEPEWAR